MKRPLSLLILALASWAPALTLTLTPGQTGRLGSQQVTLIRVQDSRCPINARCIRAGELRATVLVGTGRRLRLLTLRLPADTSSAWAGVGLTWASGVEIGQRAPLELTFTDGPT